VVRFTPRSLYPLYPMDKRLGRPQSLSGRCGEEKNRVLLICNVKAGAHEDDIVDVETCRVNNQAKCVVIDGI
jgi:hypothetical protein